MIPERATPFSRSRASGVARVGTADRFATLERCAAARPGNGQGNSALMPVGGYAMLTRPMTTYETRTISRALRAMERLLVDAPLEILGSPDAVRDYLRLRLFALEHEAFVVLYLNAQHRLIEAREMFRGTLTQTAVYPREIAKASLLLNAAAVIFAHNHPSGNHEPSSADRLLTDALRSALATIDVRVLDHVIVAGQRVTSFAERGLI